MLPMNKKTRIKINRKANDWEVEHPSDDFQGSWILTESQEFIRRTFSFLPAKVLLGVCSRVCKSWHAEATRIVHRREEIAWVALGRINMQQKSSLKPLERFQNSLKSCLNTIGSLPRLAIIFSECLDARGYLFREQLNKIRTSLPKDCLPVFVHTNGTIGLQRDLSPAGETMENDGTSCVLLPNMDGVSISCQYLLLSDMTVPYIRTNVLSADTKCMLVFSGVTRSGRFVNRFHADFYQESGVVPVIAGGIVKSLRQVHKISNQDDMIQLECLLSACLIITFSGPNVSAASIALDSEISNREAVRQKILELKKAGLSEKHSLAFMFSCIGRGSEFYGEDDVESGIFHEIFPHTPLVGFFGGGEFGCDRLTKEAPVNENNSRGPLSPSAKLVKSYSCVICLLSFGTADED